MPSASHQQQRTQYIIRANDTAQLIEFINRAGKDPDIELVEAIGPPAAPHTVVVATTSDKALALEREFSIAKSISIERDQALFPMQKDKS